jgi:hypothetical protein
LARTVQEKRATRNYLSANQGTDGSTRNNESKPGIFSFIFGGKIQRSNSASIELFSETSHFFLGVSIALNIESGHRA